MKFRSTSQTVSIGVILLLGATIGCGQSTSSGVYSVSGKITYDGKPIPRGSITFSPDSKKSNQGPGVTAEIKDGQYETFAGKGTTGGPYVLLVQAYDGVPIASGEGGMDLLGKPLFSPMELEVDLPKQNATHDIEIPKQR
ncbi:hypothetical protein AB1L30_01550 [Bremerella sp. JC817]|uniref:hypothetical protein n=1 Tax=Bremerella sp. JC817 TaxID=3231756 RepID=UPI003457B95F